MSTIVLYLVGILLLGMGYFIGVKQKISLVHSYHYKNMTQADKPAFCKGVGLGNAIIGIGILAVPLLRPLVGQTAALVVCAGAAVLAGVLVVRTILKYNHSLF